MLCLRSGLRSFGGQTALIGPEGAIMNVETPLKRIVLEPGKRSPEVLEFEERLHSKIIGQDEAVVQLVSGDLQRLRAAAPVRRAA